MLSPREKLTNEGCTAVAVVRAAFLDARVFWRRRQERFRDTKAWSRGGTRDPRTEVKRITCPTRHDIGQIRAVASRSPRDDTPMAGVAGARASGTCYINEARYKTASAGRRKNHLLTAEIAHAPTLHSAAGVLGSRSHGRLLFTIARRKGAVKQK